MQPFFKKLFIFSLPVFLLLISMEILLRKIPNDYTYKKNYLDKNATNIEVLFLGNSHIFYGINPEFISAKSFNASMGSQSLKYDAAILNKYQKQLSNLKYVVVSYDYLSLYSSLETSIESWKANNYNIYYNIKFNNNWLNNFEVLNTKFSRNLSKLKLYYKNNISQLNCDTLGFGYKYKAALQKDLITTAKNALERHSVKAIDSNCINENKKVLQNIVDFATTKNIKVIFVATPTYNTYYNNLNAGQLLATEKEIQGLIEHNTTQHNTTQHKV